MKEFVIKSDHDDNLKFVGEILACVCGDYTEDWWVRYSIYKTSNERFVCQREEVDDLINCKINECVVVDTEKEIFYFFGDDELTKELYKEVGIDFPKEM